MENIFNNPSNLYYGISAIIAALGLLGILYRIFKTIFLFLKKKYSDIESANEKIEKIFKEITPNHGTSIKDKINSLDKRMNTIDENLKRNNQLTEKMFSRQRWILDQTTGAVFESDEEGRCIWANSFYLKLIQRSLDSVVGHGWKNAIAPEDRERVIENWETCIKEGRDAEDTFTIICEDGKRVKVFCLAHKTENNGYIGSLKVLDEK
jgi:PAS domain S-box-containing protein